MKIDNSSRKKVDKPRPEEAKLSQEKEAVEINL